MNTVTRGLPARLGSPARRRRFKDIADADAYHVSLFIWPAASWTWTKVASVIPVVTYKNEPVALSGGEAFEIPSNYAFVTADEKMTPTHEVGHCLGLYHSFVDGHPLVSAAIPQDPRSRLMGYDRTENRLLQGEVNVVHERAKTLGQP